ncbi:MAG: four-carbon acid sugar kinase family protein [Candidatus Velthaea sp.]
MSGVLLGAIADDFTGATDLADMLVAGGMRTVQTIGVPGDARAPDADAVVVALKTRSIESAQAVAQSLEALEYLERIGVRQILFKYCSTFDSTARGNIGPVGDALAARCGQNVTVFCPAYPANKRSIYHGYLFVGDVLLSESGMRDHPLTPMHDANLVRVLAAQSLRPIGLIGLKDVRAGAQAIRAALERTGANGPAHVIADATDDADLYALGEALDGTRLITGGAGIALGLPENYRRRGWLGAQADAVAAPVRGGRAAVIAGSASTATQAQVALMRERAPAFDITPEHIAAPDAAVAAALAWARMQGDVAVLVTATTDAAAVRRNQERFGVEEAGLRVESILSRVAASLVESGVRRLIVAGGETSGAVVQALNVRRLRIGPRIATGVPWTIAEGERPLGLALKSGNFGAPDFFMRALEETA